MGRTALVVVDMVNTYDFEGAEDLARNVEGILEPLKGLIERAKDEDGLVIYVNDNFGEWQSHRDQLVEEALAGEYAHLVESIAPKDDALFVVKARHSIFFGTPLDYLLEQEDVDRLVLVGQATEQCILYSALDAHIRHIPVVVPRDAVAHIHEDLAEASLRMMELNMEAEVVDAADVSFSADR
jgi:nicotinamidase-related amidase